MSATSEAPVKKVSVPLTPEQKSQRSAKLFERFLYQGARIGGVQAARSTAQVAYQLGGIEGVVRLLFLRLQQPWQDLDEFAETLATYDRALIYARAKFKAEKADFWDSAVALETRSEREEMLYRRAREEHAERLRDQELLRQRISNSVPANPARNQTLAERMAAAFERNVGAA
jgi:hypothetical protein